MSEIEELIAQDNIGYDTIRCDTFRWHSITGRIGIDTDIDIDIVLIVSWVKIKTKNEINVHCICLVSAVTVPDHSSPIILER